MALLTVFGRRISAPAGRIPGVTQTKSDEVASLIKATMAEIDNAIQARLGLASIINYRLLTVV